MSRLSPRQRELLAASAVAAGRTRSGIDATAGRPPALGDLFVLAATAETPVEWLLLDRPAPEGPFLAVPGDSHPFLGSTDLEIETTAGTLRLRCGATAWLQLEALDPERRVATVAHADLGRVREKVRELAAGVPVPSPLLEDVDASPDYQEWLREAVQPAQAVAGGPGPGTPIAAPAAGSWHRNPWLVAAAALLLALGAASWAMWNQTRLHGFEARMRAAAAERDQQIAVAQALREKLAAGSGTEAPASPLINVPVAILLPDETLRGERHPVHLPLGSPYLVVVLRFPENPADRRFRVTLIAAGETKARWSEDGFTRSAEGSVQIALPRSLVPPGLYSLRLSSLRDDRLEPRGDFRLEVAP